MYVPEHFRMSDIAEMHALMRARPLATLVSAGPGGLTATLLPTVLKTEGTNGVVGCHLARANPHWKDLATAGEALMIFHGPDGYITPSWYPSKAEHQKVVPTWNYATVHAYGVPQVRQDREWLVTHVGELTDQQEALGGLDDGSQPWKLADAPAAFVEVMLRGIVGFRFEIARLEGKQKMSQNREPRDVQGVADGLARRNRGDDAEMARRIAEFAARRKPGG
jgi:transcriptional regulator